MRKKLSHALLIALVLEVHVGHETLWLGITIRALQQHSQAVNCADVIFSDINDEAGVSLLLDGDFATLLLRADLDAGFCDLNLLLV